MCQGMMWFRHADFRVGAITGFSSQLKRDHSCYITLQCQVLQVEHQSSVFGVGCGNADGAIQIWQRVFVRVSFCLLNATFDFTNGI